MILKTDVPSEEAQTHETCENSPESDHRVTVSTIT